MGSLLWLPVIGWLVSPIISFLVNKLLSYLDFNLSRKLRELELQIIPSLEQVIGDVREQRMLRGAKDEGKGSESDLNTLGELEKDLKFELHEIGDVMDLIEYRRIEKKVIGGDGKSVGTSISSWVLQVIGDCTACCKRSSFWQMLWQCSQNQNQKLSDLGDKLQQCAKDLDLKFWELLAKLQQYAQYLNKMFRELRVRAKLMLCAQSLPLYINQGAAGQPSMLVSPAARSATDGIEQGSATTPSPTPGDATSNPLTPNALRNSAGSATEFRGDNQHGSAEAPTLDATWNSLVQMICGWLMNGFSALRSFYLAARELRDWSYEPVGIKNDVGTAIDCVLSIIEIISLRKRIKDIEHIVSESKKSPLLNKSSSSTPKDADKESSSTCTVKNSSEEGSSTKKEIDDVYRSIEKEVFGRDKDREHISRMLREGPDTYAPSSSTSKPCSVIGIYGITGSGKSTLAQYVCDYEKGAGHFNIIMFVLVGKTFSVLDIFREMLDQIKQQRPTTELNGLKSLKAELEKELKGKCFLLVLDDLWVNGDNMKERGILLDVLRVGQSGSRILVTAQKKDAAAALGAHEKMQIPIPDLEEEQYLSMFMHYALEVSQVASTDYERYKAIGRKITEKLRRSPIAAITVAARLKSNNSIDFWERTSNLDVLNETMGALWWSYQQLGVDIRRCFAFCSIFPKGYGLKRDELVHMWIAEGFVNTRSNATEELEALGQSYFDQLLTFSFMQVLVRIRSGKVQVIRINLGEETVEFTIHDMLHELAERVSGGEVFRIGLNDPPKDIPRGVRHVFIETNNGAEIIEKIADMENLCTLIIKEPYEWSTVPVERNHDLEKLLERLFMRPMKLRVLITKLNQSKRQLSVPASIDQMKHLRYLGFHFHGVFSSDLIFPYTFSKLYHIQTIVIPCLKKASYPEDMANLIYLRQIPGELYFPNIGRLTSLQRLRSFRVKEGQGYGLKQLKHLNKLRGTLSIRDLGIVGSKEEALEAHLAHKERLRKLELGFGRSNGDSDVEAEVLEGLCPPKDLQELHIWEYKGSTYPSWMLSRHHSETAPKHLQKLEFFRCSQLASIPQDSELFNGLRELEIRFCDWDRLPENMERLVSLQSLQILFCGNIELLPTLPYHSLKYIIICACQVLSETCKEEGHENWRKIQQIPAKFIY